MRRVRLCFVATAVAGAISLLPALPADVRAEVVDEQEVKHFTFGFNFGFSQNRMGTYNENIDVVNHFLTHQGESIRAADRFHGSGAARGEFRYKFGQRISVGMGVSNTQSKSAFNVTWAGIDFYARATVWSPMVYYHLPFVQKMEAFSSVADRMSLYVGAGPVFLSSARTHMRITDRTTEPTFNVDGDLIELDGTGDAKGSGSGLQGLVGSSYQLTKTFSVAAEVGYRHSVVKNLEITHAQGFVRDVAKDDPKRREPETQAIIDFFKREQRAAGLPERDINGVRIPYYSDFQGPLDLDFSGIQATLGLRIHLF